MGPGLLPPQEVRQSSAFFHLLVREADSFCADGHVRVWSTDAIYNAADQIYSKPKQLASMSYHTGTIHTVRFSPNGRYLASGADDKIVCVYKLDNNPPSHAATFGESDGVRRR